MNFELLLGVAVLLTGIGWVYDHVKLKKTRVEAQKEALRLGANKAEAEEILKPPKPIEVSVSFFPVLLLVFVIRSFFFEPFQIPSGSMKPNLQIGDFILVNKFTYGVRLPFVNYEVLDLGDPEAGDVVVFRYPVSPDTYYIKRVIGLPGDLVEYQAGTLKVNGKVFEKIPDSYGVQEVIHDDGSSALCNFSILKQSIGERAFRIKEFSGSSRCGVERLQPSSWRVPEGQYFVLGDNRQRSADSRYWGFVPESLLVGEAQFIWLHWPPPKIGLKFTLDRNGAIE